MSLAEPHASAARRAMAQPHPARVYGALTAGLASAIVAAFAFAVQAWTPGALAALALVATTAVWISGGAATAILGLFTPASAPSRCPPGWTPQHATAILVTLCGEAPGAITQGLADLHAALGRAGAGGRTRIFVLSDTHEPAAIRAEEAALRDLIATGALSYRRRVARTGRKPGNIADWLQHHGADYAYMMVLDADSRMSAGRILRMIRQIEMRPRLGLLQAGIALAPGATRFARHQRVASRLLSRNFGRGFAAWTGDSGNYWGHNAIMRVAAFRAAAALPRLPGRAPLGGDLLSHDFIEAAWIRRAGWAVALDPDARGSAESAPETLAEFHRRDRRWCQGNLQHLRLLAEPGLDPLSRVHLASGILSYLVAPVWLALVVMAAAGAVPVASLVPLLVMGFVLVLPKLCALADGLRRAASPARRRVTLRAWLGEVMVSAVIAPLVMLRQTGAVLSVLAGRDCGWKSGRTREMPAGLPEMAAGAGLGAVAFWAGGGVAALWLLPVILPLLAAPLLVRALGQTA